MDISALTGLSGNYLNTQTVGTNNTSTSANSFDDILSTAMNMVTETNDYQNSAESAAVQFALGESTSTHDLLVAQEKANVALQYTVAVRDKVLDAYNQIMNMQI